MPQNRNIRTAGALTGILFVSILLKLLCWHWDPIVSRDGCLYIRLAQIWYNTGNFQGVLDAWKQFWLPPLPIYLMKCLMRLGLSAEASGVCLNLIAGTFTPLCVYGIAWEITQRKDIALCSALLIAVNPSMNALSHEVQRDMIYLLFIGIVLWLLAAGIRRQRWYYWLSAGLVCGASMLTRFETLEFCVIVPCVILFLCMAKYCSWKKGICYIGLFFCCFFGIILMLSCLMQTQDHLFQNYDRYYRAKYSMVKKVFQTELKASQK